MPVETKCDDCNKEIGLGENSYCERCWVELKSSLEIAEEKISELEEKLKGKEEGR